MATTLLTTSCPATPSVCRPVLTDSHRRACLTTSWCALVCLMCSYPMRVRTRVLGCVGLCVQLSAMAEHSYLVHLQVPSDHTVPSRPSSMGALAGPAEYLSERRQNYLPPSTAHHLLPDRQPPMGMARYQPADFFARGRALPNADSGVFRAAPMSGQQLMSAPASHQQLATLPASGLQHTSLRDFMAPPRVGQVSRPPLGPAAPSNLPSNIRWNLPSNASMLRGVSAASNGPTSDYASADREYSDVMSHPTQARELVQWAVNQQDQGGMWADGNASSGAARWVRDQRDPTYYPSRYGAQYQGQGPPV